MINIQTINGNKSIFEFSYGDTVYNNRGIPVKVIGDRYYNHIILYKLKYSDGRASYHFINDVIFTKNGKFPLRNLLQKFYPFEVELYPIQYKGEMKEALIPDPYICGALLTYGDFSRESLNLPLRLTRANSYFYHQYHVKHYDIMDENIVKFTKEHSNIPIKWKDFFKNKLPSDTYLERKIPYFIKRSSVNDRWQFIRGAFDLGYDKNIFAESECGIGHTDIRSLHEIQSILWSLGINSSIDEIKKITPNHWTHRLIVRASMDAYPNFFYNIGIAEKMISNRTTIIKYPAPVPKLKLYSIGIEGEFPYRELILEKPSIYIDSNFLPRISL